MRISSAISWKSWRAGEVLRQARAWVRWVLGHSRCGAVKGARDRVELGTLSGLLGKIRPAVDAVTEPREDAQRCSDNADLVEAVALENVRLAVAGIPERSDVLRGLQESGAIAVVGRMYDITTGAVEFLDG